LIFRKVGAPATFAVFQITGALVDKGTWDTLPISHVAHGGTFANEDVITVEFARTGDRGAAGAAGVDGSGFSFIYEKDTVIATPPVSGRWKANAATFGATTIIELSNKDAVGGRAKGWLRSLAAGRVLVFRVKETPAAVVLFKLKSGPTEVAAEGQKFEVELLEETTGTLGVETPCALSVV
jgi:hypothetical protein